jgi:hypothetical protein
MKNSKKLIDYPIIAWSLGPGNLTRLRRDPESLTRRQPDSPPMKWWSAVTNSLIRQSGWRIEAVLSMLITLHLKEARVNKIMIMDTPQDTRGKKFKHSYLGSYQTTGLRSRLFFGSTLWITTTKYSSTCSRAWKFWIVNIKCRALPAAQNLHEFICNIYHGKTPMNQVNGREFDGPAAASDSAGGHLKSL